MLHSTSSNRMVFGIGWQEAPLPAMAAIRNSVAELGISAAVHVQFGHRKPVDQDEIERQEVNRIAEAVIGALAHEEMTVFLDNFTGIDPGYFFSGVWLTGFIIRFPVPTLCATSTPLCRTDAKSVR